MEDEKITKEGEEALTYERVTKKVFERDMFTGNKIYLDLRLFFDFTIGNLLQLNPDKRKYITDRIYDYKLNKDIDLKLAFPDIDTDEKLLNNNYKEHPNEIFINSPLTVFYEIFKVELVTIQNHIYVLKNTKEVILNINTYPLKLDKSILDVIKRLFIRDIPNVEVNFIYLNLSITKKERKFRNYSIYFVYYFSEATKNPFILDIFEEFKYIKKSFYIYLATDDKMAKDLISEAFFICFKFVKVIDKDMCMPLNIGKVSEWTNKKTPKEE